MFTLTDITITILEAVMRIIEPLLKICMVPQWGQSEDSVCIQVGLGGVTIRYTAAANPETGEDPIFDAFQGCFGEDDDGTLKREAMYWRVVVDVEDGEDPFFNIARNYPALDFFLGTPWEALDHAKWLLATWVTQAGVGLPRKE